MRCSELHGRGRPPGAPVSLHHPDPLVRERAAVPLQAWADAEALLALVVDSDFGVRESAMYRLGLLPPDARIAAVAWDYLNRPGVFGVHASETLGTFAAHADRDEAVPKPFAIAAGPAGEPAAGGGARPRRSRSGRGSGAADRLVGRAAGGHLGAARRGLGAVADLGLAAGDVSHLEAVDNLFVQAAVAKVAGRRS